MLVGANFSSPVHEVPASRAKQPASTTLNGPDDGCRSTPIGPIGVLATLVSVKPAKSDPPTSTTPPSNRFEGDTRIEPEAIASPLSGKGGVVKTFPLP